MMQVGNRAIIYGCRDTDAVAEKICSGSIGIFPTSTIYGISCIYNNEELLKRVYEIKQRPANMPFITIIPDKEWLEKIACDIDNVTQALAQKYWLPESSEPLTLVVNKAGFKQNAQIQKENASAAANRKTIALRVDPLPGLAEILKLTGPLISTSATISGTDIAPKTITGVPPAIREKVDFIFDYGKPLAGLASTIVDVTGKSPVLLREGSLKYCDIISYLAAKGFAAPKQI